jgi:hypothetical protein
MKAKVSHIEFEDGTIIDVKGMNPEEVYAWIETRYKDAEVGYFPDRGLVWETEEDSRNDDGQHAVATIHYLPEAAGDHK